MQVIIKFVLEPIDFLYSLILLLFLSKNPMYLINRFNKFLANQYVLISENTCVFLSIIIVINIVSKLFFITDESYYLDEAVHIYHSQMSLKEMIKLISLDPNPPLFNIILSFWVKIFGITEYSTRSISIIVNTFTLIVLFKLAKRFFNKETAIYSVLFFLVSHFQFNYALEARPYSLITLLVVLSFYYLIKIQDNPKILNIIIYTIINSLLIYTHTPPVFILPAQFIYLFIFNFSQNKKAIAFVLISQILSVVSFYFWYRISVYSKSAEIYTWMTPPSLAYIRTTIQLLLNGKLLYYLTVGFLIFFILKLFLTERQGSIYREKFKKISLPFLWWFIPFTLTIIVSYLFKPFFAPKYLVYVIPGFILMNAFIISNIQLTYNYIIKTLLVVLIIMKSTVNIVEIKRSGVFNLEKWKQAVQFIKERESSNSIILGTADYQMASFVYYYNKDYFKNINKTKELLKSEDIYFFRGVQKLNKINYNQYDEVILVYSHEEVVYPEKKIKNTIEQNYHLSDVFNTPKVKVFIYKKEDNTTREFYIDYENMNNQYTELYDSAPSGKRVSYVYSNVEYSAGIKKNIVNSVIYWAKKLSSAPNIFVKIKVQTKFGM